MAFSGSRTLTIEIVGDSASAERSADRTAGKFGKLQNASAKTAKAIGLISLAGVGLAAGGGALAVKFASDLAESQSKANVVFGESVDVINDLASNAATSLGLTKAEALEASASMGAMFDAMQLSKVESADMSASMVRLAGDMASFNNEDPTEMLDRLRAGLTGEAEPLKRFGVLLNAAAVEQEALRLGLQDASGELDEAAKVQARYSIILKQTSLQQGDFARTSDGMANQIRILKAQATDLAAELGTVLLPMVEQVLGLLLVKLGEFSAWVSANRAEIEDFFIQVAEAGALMWESFATGLEVVGPLLIRFFSWILDNKVALVAAILAIGAAVVFALGPVSAAAAAIAGIILLIGFLKNNWEEVALIGAKSLRSLVKAIGGFVDASLDRLGDLIEFIASTFVPIWNAIAAVSLGQLPRLDLSGFQVFQGGAGFTNTPGLDALVSALEGRIVDRRRDDFNRDRARAGETVGERIARELEEERQRREGGPGGSPGISPPGGNPPSFGGGGSGGGSGSLPSAGPSASRSIRMPFGFGPSQNRIFQSRSIEGAGDVIVNITGNLPPEVISQEVLKALQQARETGRIVEITV